MVKFLRDYAPLVWGALLLIAGLAMAAFKFGSRPDPLFLAVATTLVLAVLLVVALRAGFLSGARARQLLRSLSSTTSELNEVRAVHEAFFNSTGSANCILDHDSGRILRVNDAMCSLLGRARDELIGETFEAITSRETGETPWPPNDAIAFDRRFTLKDGGEVWGLVSARPVLDAGGRPKLITMVIVDISARKKDEAIKANLLHELAHRLRNTVQLTQSLADQTGRSARTAKDYATNFRRRLNALSAAQDLLFDAEWRSADLAGLAARILQPFQNPSESGGSSQIEIRLPHVELPTQHAQTLAVAFHELAANSLRHGALSESNGHIALAGELAMDGDAKQLAMTWQETGGPAVRKPRRAGFGLIVLTRLLPSQYGGEARFEWKRSGLVYRCSLTIPPAETAPAVNTLAES
jgi:PAS domain S-box-containing protein